jgi:hypothetical protein
MIIKRVKTIWQGKVAIADKHLALAKQGGIQIVHGDKSMTIPAKEVEKRVVARSEESFQDKWSRETYHLYYFNWVADKEKQMKLI